MAEPMSRLAEIRAQINRESIVRKIAADWEPADGYHWVVLVGGRFAHVAPAPR